MKGYIKLKKFSFIFIMILGLAFFAACGKKEDKDKEKEEKPTYEYNTEYTDGLKLSKNYENLSFLTDGIGLVRLTQTVDGDTAHFIDLKTGTRFTGRFLNINTPESTGRIDPWGKEASKFVSGILNKAHTIVCESSEVGKPAEKDTTMKRYLSLVWYKLSESDDFRLLNLEVVEKGYSRFTGVVSEAPYGDTFGLADTKNYALKVKVYGELDPNYDYSGEVQEVTIAEIRNNLDNYTGGSNLKITARVMRLVGSNIYLQDLNETWDEEENRYEVASIYMYSGYGANFTKFPIGQVIEFECQCVVNDTYGTQLTNPSKVRRVTNTDSYSVTELDGTSQINLSDWEGFVVSIKNVTVNSLNNPDLEGAYTIYCQTESGQKINLRVDGSAFPAVDYDSIQTGKKYDIIGGVSKFNDSFQIMLGNQKDEAVNDFVLSK